MPVLDWRRGVTGFSDAYIKARLPKSRPVQQNPKNEWTLRVARSGVIVDKQENPTGSTTRVYRGLFPEVYRPGGVLYKP